MTIYNLTENVITFREWCVHVKIPMKWKEQKAPVHLTRMSYPQQSFSINIHVRNDNKTHFYWVILKTQPKWNPSVLLGETLNTWVQISTNSNSLNAYQPTRMVNYHYIIFIHALLNQFFLTEKWYVIYVWNILFPFSVHFFQQKKQQFLWSMI